MISNGLNKKSRVTATRGWVPYSKLRKQKPRGRNAPVAIIYINWKSKGWCSTDALTGQTLFCLNKLTCKRTSFVKDLMIKDHLNLNLMELIRFVKSVSLAEGP